jgi:hypothetical protein
MYHSDFMMQKLVAEHIADLQAEAARERLARQVAPNAVDVDRMIFMLIVTVVALSILLAVV